MDERFWALNVGGDPDQPQPYGEQTSGVCDEQEGGYILYCHDLTVARILAALRAQAKEE